MPQTDGPGAARCGRGPGHQDGLQLENREGGVEGVRSTCMVKYERGHIVKEEGRVRVQRGESAEEDEVEVDR